MIRTIEKSMYLADLTKMKAMTIKSNKKFAFYKEVWYLKEI